MLIKPISTGYISQNYAEYWSFKSAFCGNVLAVVHWQKCILNQPAMIASPELKTEAAVAMETEQAQPTWSMAELMKDYSVKKKASAGLACAVALTARRWRQKLYTEGLK